MGLVWFRVFGVVGQCYCRPKIRELEDLSFGLDAQVCTLCSSYQAYYYITFFNLPRPATATATA